MTDTDDSGRVSDTDSETGRVNINRRGFMQASGVAGASVLGASGVASAQLAGDDSIRLVASEGGPLSEYATEDGDVVGATGLADAINDWRAGDISTDTLLDVIEHWRTGDAVDGAGTRSWDATSPPSLQGQSNPTLSLQQGEEYSIELSNSMDEEITFVVADATGNEIESFETMSAGGSTTATFTASSSMASYYAEEYPEEMSGGIEITSVPEPTEDMISVLMMGGPEGGSHNAPARQVQITEYMLNRGIEIQYTDRLADLESDVLHRYDAWIMIDNRGAGYGQALSDEQEQSIVEFVENGGGFVPIHSASACFTESEAYMNLVGGQFAAHNVSTFTTEFAQPDHPILANLDPIETEDESYRHTNLNDDINVLAYAQFPESDSIPEIDDGREQGEPWSWTRTQGDGRVFYTAWGHGRGPWAEPGFKALIENAIRWVTKNEDTIADDTRVLDELEFMDADVPYYPPPEGSLLSPEVPEEVGSGTNWERMQRALSPDETVRRTITPEGFDLQAFVTENDLPDGVEGNILDAKFDVQGRAWLALTQDYPNELGEGRDQIVICEDTDGDGQADEFTVFADDLSIPTSMVLVDDGVLVVDLDDPSESGKLVHLRDTNDDDQADERTVLFSGYGNGDTHAAGNELVHGVDNWIWGQVGYSGLDTTVNGTEYSLGSGTYRFKFDGSEVTDFEIAYAVGANQAGIGFTEEGLVFNSLATQGRPSNYIPIVEPYYDLIEGTDPTDFGPASDTNRFLPVTDRVRQVDYHGGYTAAASHTIYTAREYPEKYWNNTGFVSDGTGHILGTFFFEQDGAGYTNHYAHNIAGGTDAWFAPSYTEMGPDGMMWFIDWYNYIYQHNPTPSGFDNGPGNAYMTELRDNATARLFRVTYGDETAYEPMDLSGASPSELVEALSSDNMFWRLKAQRMLVQRGETDVVGDLVNLVTTETLDEIGLDTAAIHALWTLHGLGALDADTGDDTAITAAQNAATHSSAGVRLTALRVIPGGAGTFSVILDNDLLMDDDKRVAMWALIKLAQTPESDASGEAVYEMISTEPNYEDNILVDAASIAGAQHANGFITAYEANEDTGDTGTPDPDDLPNQFENPGFETPAGGDDGSDDPMPAGWETNTFTGSATYTYADVGYEGDHSVQVTSSEGADATWRRTVSVEQDTEYTLTAYIQTENLELVDGTGLADVDNSPYGAAVTVEQLANANFPDIDQSAVAGPVTDASDWTEVTTTFNSGSNSELTINMLYGGYGEATGSAWYDSVSLVDPDGNDVMENGGFEESTGGEAPVPAEWSTNTFAGSAEYTYAEVGQDGSRSVQISSSEGADAVWFADGVEVEPETEYTLSGYIRTEDVQVEGSARGALFNVHTTDFETDTLTGTNDWTEVSTTFTTGADTTTVQINALFGGYGNATGTAWFDNVSLTDPDGNNLLPNASFEESTQPEPEPAMPAAWSSTTYGGTAEFGYTSEVSRSGDYSVYIDSTEGADASWNQTVDGLDANSTYRFRVWVRVDDDFSNSEDGFGEIGASYGVTLNHSVGGEDAVNDYYTEPFDGWQMLETTLETGAAPGPVGLNLLYGGYGNATGKVWFDDAELKKIAGFGGGLETVYERVLEHVELTSGDGDDGSDDGGDDTPEAIPAGTTIEFDTPSNEIFAATAPSSISGTDNPTLTLEEGAEYTVEWTNTNGSIHNFQIMDTDETGATDGVIAGTDLVQTQGESASVTFTASTEMVRYRCQPHDFNGMGGPIEIVSSDGGSQ
ncbi:DUF7133 domain-containing protein [Salinigranum sp. GCM10025319]|uniref:DUF7133 domain-containing protein n=1 Tax=Salinigranum sp. GCM10025319 TaxID=3252687 RepID=UPI0036192960